MTAAPNRTALLTCVPNAAQILLYYRYDNSVEVQLRNITPPELFFVLLCKDSLLEESGTPSTLECFDLSMFPISLCSSRLCSESPPATKRRRGAMSVPNVRSWVRFWTDIRHTFLIFSCCFFVPGSFFVFVYIPPTNSLDIPVNSSSRSAHSQVAWLWRRPSIEHGCMCGKSEDISRLPGGAAACYHIMQG